MISFVRSQFAHTFDSRWPNKTNWLSHTVLGIASGLAAHVISEKISDYINDLYLRRYIREGIGELMADLPCTECGLYDSGEICDFCDDLCYETVITKGPDGQNIVTCIECLYREVKELRRTLEMAATETWNSVPDYDNKDEFDPEHTHEGEFDLPKEYDTATVTCIECGCEKVIHADERGRFPTEGLRDWTFNLEEGWSCSDHTEVNA